MTGPVALVGSGEYLPAMADMERGLLAGRAPRFVQLATAAAPEGARSLARWHELGRQAALRYGVEQVVLPVVDAADADDPGIAELVEGAGLVYLSGGSPPYLAGTLRGSRVWTAIHAAWQDGAALAGCSAGAMALSGSVPHLWQPDSPPEPGLGAVPQLSVLPHFDRFVARLPEPVLARLSARSDGVTVIGIDEETALVGGPDEWDVVGRASVWVLTAHGREEHPAGTRMLLPRS